MQTVLKPSTFPSPARPADDAYASTSAPLANHVACTVCSERSASSGYLLPCPMTCVGVKFQDLRWGSAPAA